MDKKLKKQVRKYLINIFQEMDGYNLVLRENPYQQDGYKINLIVPLTEELKENLFDREKPHWQIISISEHRGFDGQIYENRREFTFTFKHLLYQINATMCYLSLINPYELKLEINFTFSKDIKRQVILDNIL